jgi:hypothetical protein
MSQAGGDSLKSEKLMGLKRSSKTIRSASMVAMSFVIVVVHDPLVDGC